MRYQDFLNNLDIYQTHSEKGKGVRCNIHIYLYPDGYSYLYCSDKNGKNLKKNKEPVSMVTSDPLRTSRVLIDVVAEMRKKVHKING